MDKETTKKKLILAVLQGDDYADTVDELNRGGFLKKKSMTLMIGVEEARLQGALDILKQCAGRRQQMTYSDLSMSAGGPNPAIPVMPVQMSVGGVVVFVADLDDIKKF